MYTESPDTFDRSSPLPIYLQLANWAEAKIVERQFAVGAKLPSESHLARQFRLNRNTVRQAIALLVQSGLVEKRKGIGNFVVRGTALLPTHQLGRMTSFVDDFQRHTVEIEDTILSKEKVKAPGGVGGACRAAAHCREGAVGSRAFALQLPRFRAAPRDGHARLALSTAGQRIRRGPSPLDADPPRPSPRQTGGPQARHQPGGAVHVPGEPGLYLAKPMPGGGAVLLSWRSLRVQSRGRSVPSGITGAGGPHLRPRFWLILKGASPPHPT